MGRNSLEVSEGRPDGFSKKKKEILGKLHEAFGHVLPEKCSKQLLEDLLKRISEVIVARNP